MTIGGLGSGLDFLYDENAADVQVKKTLRLSELEPNRDQPRKIFSEEAIAALADSIQRYGMLQPILVRPYGLNYQIVAGVQHGCWGWTKSPSSSGKFPTRRPWKLPSSRTSSGRT